MRNRNTANSSTVDVYTDLLVLKSSQLDQNLGGGMLDLQELEDGGPVVGDGYIPVRGHHQLVQALHQYNILNFTFYSHVTSASYVNYNILYYC